MEYRYNFSLSLTSAPEGVGCQRHAPAALPPRKTRYPLYRRLVGSPAWTGGEISPLPAFDPRTVQSVVSHCTDYAMSAYRIHNDFHKFCMSVSLRQSDRDG